MDMVVLANNLAHPEGPARIADGSTVFVETYRERVSAWHPARGVTVYSNCGGAPNACATGRDGVYITQMGSGTGAMRSSAPTIPGIQKIDPNGRVTHVVTQIENRALVAPNDLCFGRSGRLYFTDPDEFDPNAPRDGYIFGLEPDGKCCLALNVGPVFPNGIICLADESIVWVESYTRAVRRREQDGAIHHIATVPEGHMPDGFKADTSGRLYITTIMSGGIDVVDLRGGEPEFIRTGGRPLNCLFAGTDLIVADDGEPAAPTQDAAAPGRLLKVSVGRSSLPLSMGSIAAPVD
ncbi:MAG: SMP-30/gluconolactonase/LRE family protein [Devosia sp.]